MVAVGPLSTTDTFRARVTITNCFFESTSPHPALDISGVDSLTVEEIVIRDEQIDDRFKASPERIRTVTAGMTGSVRIGPCRECGICSAYEAGAETPTHRDIVECVMSR